MLCHLTLNEPTVLIAFGIQAFRQQQLSIATKLDHALQFRVLVDWVQTSLQSHLQTELAVRIS
jgi:hypothetical protein